MSFFTRLAAGLLAFSAFVMPVSAKEAAVSDEPARPSETATIDIELEGDEKYISKAGVTFWLTEAADITEDMQYVSKGAFKDVDFNDLKTARDTQQLLADLQAKAATEKEPARKAVTDKTGKAQIKDVDKGLYLLWAKDLKDYELISPALVRVPAMDKDREEWTITITPKHYSLPRVKVNKVDSATMENITSSAFEFTMYSDPECKKEIKVQAGDEKTGVAEFSVAYDTVYIRESKAPEGYQLSDEVVKVQFTDGWKMLVNDREVKDEGNFVYSIVYQDALLPSSGGNTDAHTSADNGTGYGIAAICLVIMAVILGCYVYKSRKKKGN